MGRNHAGQKQILSLPGRKAVAASDRAFDIGLIAATETPIERPKKNNGAPLRARTSGTRIPTMPLEQATGLLASTPMTTLLLATTHYSWIISPATCSKHDFRTSRALIQNAARHCHWKKSEWARVKCP